MDTVPPEVVALILDRLGGFAPAVRAVCRQWRQLVLDSARRGPAPAHTLGQLAALGHGDLLRGLAPWRFAGGAPTRRGTG
jgi:hypothetical protein